MSSRTRPEIHGTKEKAQDRRERLWNLRVQGWSYERIGRNEKPPISKQRVHAILKPVYERAQKLLDGAVAEQTIVQLARLEHIADEAMEAWRRSNEELKKLVSKEKDGGTELIKTMEERCGHTAYLKECRAALADIRKMLGMDAPERTEIAADVRHSGTIEQPITPEARLATALEICDEIAEGEAAGNGRAAAD